ncbi:hypothetical protein Sspor_81150 [Streptomyces spororaveus]|uniref:Uncharacterized protein n=1 Tax=Streptomyces spororaveus TaxID=284039 RepID=A0ABQ3TQ54_9ACTN|nr:hypothetical protein Sspor_81150 [Streptomyces spororaveus]
MAAHGEAYGDRRQARPGFIGWSGPALSGAGGQPIHVPVWARAAGLARQGRGAACSTAASGLAPRARSTLPETAVG